MIRTKLIEELAYELRHAEDAYLDSDLEDDSEKLRVFAKIEAANLSPDEETELDDWCDGLAI